MEKGTPRGQVREKKMIDPRRKQLLRQILESTLTELHAWRVRPLPEQDIQAYVEILVHYLKRESNQLENVSRYASLDEFPELYWLATLRVHICAGTVKLEHVRHFLASVPKHGLWWPEILFVAGMALESCGQSREAKQKFLAAEEALFAMGAVKKSAKARFHADAIGESATETAEAAARETLSGLPALSKMEHNLLRCVTERPHSKFELAERLFARTHYAV